MHELVTRAWYFFSLARIILFNSKQASTQAHVSSTSFLPRLPAPRLLPVSTQTFSRLALLSSLLLLHTMTTTSRLDSLLCICCVRVKSPSFFLPSSAFRLLSFVFLPLRLLCVHSFPASSWIPPILSSFFGFYIYRYTELSLRFSLQGLNGVFSNYFFIILPHLCTLLSESLPLGEVKAAQLEIDCEHRCFRGVN